MSKQSQAIVREVHLTCETDTLIVSDPCYVDEDDAAAIEALTGATDVGREGLHFAVPGCRGDWAAEVQMMESERYRVGKLVLTREGGYPRGHDRVYDHREVIGLAGVDSGQMYVGCSSNLPLDYDALIASYGDDMRQRCLAFGGGIVSSTGWGDGVYAVTVWRQTADHVTKIEVDFEDAE